MELSINSLQNNSSSKLFVSVYSSGGHFTLNKCFYSCLNCYRNIWKKGKDPGKVMEFFPCKKVGTLTI